MSINDKYYNHRNINYNGNDLTVSVGTFTIDGDVEVTGAYAGSIDASNISSSSDFIIDIDHSWSFSNNDKTFFYFDNTSKRMAFGYDFENLSMSTSDKTSLPYDFCFFSSEDSGFADKYIALFENSSSEIGASVMRLAINREDSSLSSTSQFLDFCGFQGSGYRSVGYISGASGDVGLRIRGENTLELVSDNLNCISDNLNCNSGEFLVDVDGSNMSSPNVGTQIRFRDTSSAHGSILSKFVFDGFIANETDSFIKFRDQDGTLGSIRGAPFGAFEFIGNADGTSDAALGAGTAASLSSSGRGLSFVSGNQDFGEWFYFKDAEEWFGEEESYKRLNEGIVVYVKGEEFSKLETEGSIPMIVTRSAAFVGNEKEILRPGEILSLIGQIFVLIEGGCSCGDYIIPKENHCVAVRPEDITFLEYKRALGKALYPKKSEEMGHVKCLIGVK